MADKSKPKRRHWATRAWEPIKTEAEALKAAQAARLPAGWLLGSYVLLAAIAKWVHPPGDSVTATIVTNLVVAIFAGGLLAWVWRTNGRVPAVLALVWIALEIAFKWIDAVNAPGASHANVGWLIVQLALLSAGVLGVRGAFKLRRFRSDRIKNRPELTLT